MESWHSYPKIYALGHSAISDLLRDEVTVEEKVDGSQFSFGIFNGEIKCRSKGCQIVIDAPEKMFSKAVETVKSLAPLLHEGWTYRAEYLQKPKHNTIAYNRIPHMHLIGFDIASGHETYLNYKDKAAEFERLGLEYVREFKCDIRNPEEILKLLENDSVLGGHKIEGVVIKNYTRYTRDGKTMMGKYVSEAFKERNSKEWKKSNPNGRDFIANLGLIYNTEARWHKSIQHLKEEGKLTNTPKDIGLLIKEIANDTKEECREEIMNSLFAYAWPFISRGIIRGFPEFYKQLLMESQFNDKEK